MKKATPLLFAIIVLLGNVANASDYLPILTEGKVWNCADTLLFGTKYPFTLEMKGDTVAYNLSCKKVYGY